MTEYDSRPDTEAHIARVQDLLAEITASLRARARLLIEAADTLDARGPLHDLSKLEEPEKSAFDRATQQLHDLTYGTAEYKASLQELSAALTHHYGENRHHPEHYPNGINDMTLDDVQEMMTDWKASTERHADGNLRTSIDKNQARFGISDQLTRILHNTRRDRKW